jgi:uncharacterized protein involved in response to NO
MSPLHPNYPLYATAFRPFFLLAGLAALLPVLAWVLAFAGAGWPQGGHYGLRNWHAHEMLFGYAVAVMAGFLLTAIRNWTGRPTASGGALAALAALWLAGRLVSLPGANEALPGLLVAIVDSAFLPALAIAAARPLLASGNQRNLIFPGMLLMLAGANLLVHAALLGALPALVAERTLEGAALVAILMITVMAGRVFPFFTERGLGVPFRATVRPWVERLAAPSVIVFAVAWLLRDTLPVLLLVVAPLAASVHALRLAGWYTPAVWRVPLLWVLHLGYAWLVIGFALATAVALDQVAFNLAMHAFTAGTLATVTLGMMARVALGHTGRPLVAARAIAVAFALVSVAALCRVLLPLLLPDAFAILVQVAGVAWLAAYVIFVAVYLPVLTQPRVDGAPG